MTEDFKKILSNGWRVSDPYAVEKNTQYRERITLEQMESGHPPPKQIPTFKSEEEKKTYIFEMQQPSTKAALLAQKDRKPEDDLEHLLRPIPQNYLANPEASTHDELTAMRPLKPDEIAAHMRTKSGRNQLGDSKASSIKDKREAGIHAFTYSKPYQPSVEELKQFKRLDQLDAVIKEAESKAEHPKESWLFRASCWLKEKTGVWWW